MDVKDPNDILKTRLHGVIIPCLLIIFGISIQNISFLPHTLAILAVFLAVKFYLSYRRLNYSSLDAKKYVEFEMIDKTIISKNSAIYRFKLANESDRLNIPVGYHLECRVNINGEECIRYYTPISNQFDEGFFDLLIKSYKDNGKVSKYFASLLPGKKVEFRGPVGRFSYEMNQSKEIYMIAGGSGITPMLQVISKIVTTPEDFTKIHLIFANETENDILLKDELDDFSEKYPNFKVNYLLRNPPSADWSKESNYDVGLVDTQYLAKHLPAPDADKRVLICGTVDMRKSVIKSLSELGWEKGVLKSQGDDQVFCF